MRILTINTRYQYSGSTGRIAYDLVHRLRDAGYEAYAAYGYDKNVIDDSMVYCIESIRRRNISALETRIWDNHCYYNIDTTRRFLKWVDVIKPDIIHMQNLHNHYMNIQMLFDYAEEKRIPLVWTLQDCWILTGHCATFDHLGCEKWKTGCGNCPAVHEYPETWLFDRSAAQYKKKKKTLDGRSNLTLITPSEWLKTLVESTYLNQYKIKVINNGIDTTVFKPTYSDFREKHNLQNKKIVLCVANIFEWRKGTDLLFKLPSLLSDEFKLVLVGKIPDEVQDKIPSNCIKINRTESIDELAALYTVADIVVNPTLTDNFPTINLESLACGTPVITYRTGGSPESLDENTGRVVDKGDEMAFIEAILEMTTRPKPVDLCRKRALTLYDKQLKYQEYIDLFEEIYNASR